MSREAAVQQRDALTELVQQHVGAGRRWSTREFAAIAIDPDTGWSPGKSMIAKFTAGQSYSITPRLVSAIAAGLGLPRQTVAAAAHWQTIGYLPDELTDWAVVDLLRLIPRHAS